MTYTYAYPRPSVTVDIIIIDCFSKPRRILLIERGQPPFAGSYALPGGFVDLDENLNAAACRELEEETGLRDIALEQFYTFGDKGRDPRGHTVSVVYFGYLTHAEQKAIAGDDAANVKWFDFNDLPPMAFDHNKILEHFLSKNKIIPR